MTSTLAAFRYTAAANTVSEYVFGTVIARILIALYYVFRRPVHATGL